MDWPDYVKVASGRSLSWGTVSCMGDWVRAFVGIFFFFSCTFFIFYDNSLSRWFDLSLFHSPYSNFQYFFLFPFLPIVHVRYIYILLLCGRFPYSAY